jgi:site-specific DNA-methyltransferase (adenine-specific)
MSSGGFGTTHYKITKMIINTTTDGTGTNTAITYSECYAQVFSRLFLGDCLIESDKIETGSVDLILTDLPYGNMKGINNPERPKSWGNKEYFKWDDAIESKCIYEIANRILRKNGKMILFSQEPYTSRMITEAIPNTPFNYRMIWEKNDFANALLCNKAPVSYFEDILIFSKNECYEAKHPLRTVMIKYVERTSKEFIIDLMRKEGRYTSGLSARVHASYKFGFNDGMRFDLMDEKLYNYFATKIRFDETYAELKVIDEQFKNEFASTFNLWEGNKYKSNILKYKKDYDGYHPTQKPVLLLEDLIKTFSNENDLVVDLTMGSGSTGVACKNTNRSFIGIEKDEAYFKIAEQRINARMLFS